MQTEVATQITMRPDLPPLPARMRNLPLDKRGYPVPKFVLWTDGVPDFRIMDTAHWVRCIKERMCWVCGEPFTHRRGVFVLGPMCAVNRTTSEPPCHEECALYSVKACPFLTRPGMVRRVNDLPEDVSSIGGQGIKRNPGVTLLWEAKQFTVWNDGDGGKLLRVGDPISVCAYREGREATFAETMESIVSGFPLLEEFAKAQSTEAVIQLHVAMADSITLLRRELRRG